MAPRWFKNVKFGTNLTNLPVTADNILEHFRDNLEKQFKEVTFESTGPIIEEADSEDEVPLSTIGPLSLQRDSSSTSLKHSSSNDEPSLEENVQAHSIERAVQNTTESKDPVEAVESIEAVAVEPIAFEPITEETTAVEPTTVEPTTVEPTAVEPTPVEPTVVEPTPVEPTAVEPTPVEPTVVGPIAVEPIRRSKRKRWAPLDFARGERPVYKRSGVTFELAGFEAGFPKQYNYGRTKRNQTREPKSKNTNQARVKIPKDAELIGPIEWKEAEKGDYQKYIRTYDSMIVGAIRLEPGKTKPIAKTGCHRYMFLVKAGQVLIKIFTSNDAAETKLVDENSEWITIDPGRKYAITNCGSRISNVIFILSEV